MFQTTNQNNNRQFLSWYLINHPNVGLKSHTQLTRCVTFSSQHPPLRQEPWRRIQSLSPRQQLSRRLQPKTLRYSQLASPGASNRLYPQTLVLKNSAFWPGSEWSQFWQGKSWASDYRGHHHHQLRCRVLWNLLFPDDQIDQWIDVQSNFRKKHEKQVEKTQCPAVIISSMIDLLDTALLCNYFSSLSHQKASSTTNPMHHSGYPYRYRYPDWGLKRGAHTWDPDFQEISSTSAIISPLPVMGKQ